MSISFRFEKIVDYRRTVGCVKRERFFFGVCVFELSTIDRNEKGIWMVNGYISGSKRIRPEFQSTNILLSSRIELDANNGRTKRERWRVLLALAFANRRKIQIFASHICDYCHSWIRPTGPYVYVHCSSVLETGPICLSIYLYLSLFFHSLHKHTHIFSI